MYVVNVYVYIVFQLSHIEATNINHPCDSRRLQQCRMKSPGFFYGLMIWMETIPLLSML